MQFYFKFLFDLLRSNINNCEIYVIVDSFFVEIHHLEPLEQADHSKEKSSK